MEYLNNLMRIEIIFNDSINVNRIYRCCKLYIHHRKCQFGHQPKILSRLPLCILWLLLEKFFEFYQFELFLTYFHLNRVSMLSHKCSYHHQLFDLISKGTHQRKFTFGDQPKCQVLHKIQLGPNLIHSGQST